MTNIKANILQSVVKNKISMIPRWKFILYSLLLIISAIFSFALLVFVGSLIIFVLSIHGFVYLPFFEFGELLNSIRAIPFALFVLAVVLLIIVELLVRNYAFSFRKSAVTTVLVLTVSALTLSLLITFTPIHKEIRNYAKSHHLSFVTREYERPFPLRKTVGLTVLRGIVISTTTNSVVVELSDDTTQVVYASTTTTKPVKLPEEGQGVVIFGHVVDDKFEAVDIRTYAQLPF